VYLKFCIVELHTPMYQDMSVDWIFEVLIQSPERNIVYENSSPEIVRE
jgi:hypothetical protein